MGFWLCNLVTLFLGGDLENLNSMLPILLLCFQNSLISFGIVGLIYHNPSFLQLVINRKEMWTNNVLCGCVRARGRACRFIWGRSSAADSIAIYTCGCTLKTQCCNQKYLLHFEQGKFFLWFVLWSLFVELVFIFRCIFVSQNDYNIANYPGTVSLSPFFFAPFLPGIHS